MQIYIIILNYTWAEFNHRMSKPVLRGYRSGIGMSPESFHIFATPEWERNGDNAWRNGIGMELSAFCPE